MAWRAIFGAVLVLLAAGAPARADHPEFTSYDELQTAVKDWERRGARVEVPAKSDAGRDITLVSVGGGPIKLLLLAELHANEPSGSEALVRMFELLLGNPAPTFAADRLPGVKPEAPLFRALSDPVVREELLRRVTISGFPMMDPDGAEDGHTRNQQANSDYTTRLTPQSAAIAAAVRTLEPDLMVDLHGGPDSPDLNVGYMKADGIEAVISQASIQAAGAAWRTADALGMKLAYWEEWPTNIALGLHGDPFTSIDQAYYDLLTGTVPITQGGYALEGLPVFFTETVGLQSAAPSISVSQGASVQQATIGGLALDLAGLLTGDVALKSVSSGRSEIDVAPGARRLFAVAQWSGIAEDHRLVVRTADGRELASSGGGEIHPTRRSRAVAIDAPPTGRLIVEADPPTTVRVTWREPDANRRPLEGILGPPERVAFCLSETTLWDGVNPAWRAPACNDYKAEQPHVSAPASLPRRCLSRRRFTIRIGKPRRGRIVSTRVTVGGRRVRVRRGRAIVDLRGRRAGTYTVRIRVRTTRATYDTLRRYRTCAPRPK